MKKLFLSLSFMLVSLFVYSQVFDVDELIHLRNMDKSEIDSYLKSKNSNWGYFGFEREQHFWKLETGVETENIMFVLHLSLESKDKNYVFITTYNENIYKRILSQIQKYGMKKISSKTEDIDGSRLLTEEYQGKNYKIMIRKTFDKNGVAFIAVYLKKNF